MNEIDFTENDLHAYTRAGQVWLEQTDYAGEISAITLHPRQLIHVAEQLRGADRMTESIHRRLLELQSDLRYFTDADLWIDEIAERITDGLAFQIGASAMRCALDQIITDMGLVPLDAEPEQEPVEPEKPRKFLPMAPPKQYKQGDLLGGEPCL